MVTKGTMAGKVVFTINGKEQSIGGEIGPEVSLNDYLRSHVNLRGTKSMCHEGGCGACVVAVRAPHPLTKELKLFAVNSCLVSALSCHGWEVITVEGLGNKIDGYHDVQTRLANFNGSQCGYCTPGWVMNMYSLYEAKNKKLSMKEVENSFAGNLCRCTGYRPILDAFKSLATDADKELLDRVCDLEDLGLFKTCGYKCKNGAKCSHKVNKNKEICSILGKFDYSRFNRNKKSDSEESENSYSHWSFIENVEESMIEIDSGNHKWYKAYTIKDIFDAMSKARDYMLVAGNTGQGVFHITDFPETLIDISSVQELKNHEINNNLILGAGMTLNEMMDYFIELSSSDPNFGYLKVFFDHMDLVAHVPVRNIGTIGGNLSLKHQHNDFQSDLFLLFETVGGFMTLFDGSEKITLEVSMLDYLKTDMKGKLIYNIKLPPLSQKSLVKTYKIMPRSQNAHAIVNAGFHFHLDQDMKRVEKASIVYGSISGSFNHATNTEKALIGKELFMNDTLQLALKTLSEEIFPEAAVAEPSPAYRKMLAIALFYKAILSLSPADKLDPRMKSGGEVLSRPVSKGTQMFDTDKSLWPLNQPIPKLEALVQCSGEATYANDLPTQPGELFGAFVLSTVAAGTIQGFDTADAMKLDGVIAFYSAKDIPGKNSFTPISMPLVAVDEEIFCSGEVKYYGQPVGLIVATREKTANKAARLVTVNYTLKANYKPVLTINDALNAPDKSSRLVKNITIEPKDTGKNVKSIIHGEYKMGSQYHYFMETQTTVAKPTEDGLEVYSASQWLDITNVAIAESLKIPVNEVNVIVRRVGGAYGGKITRSTQAACAAALVAHLRRTTCRVILPLQTSMASVGKRLPTMCSFEVGMDSEGEIQYLKNKFYQDNGCSHNETITPITVEHFNNCYEHDRWFIEANSVITDTPSNTWCRAPASTEGIAMIEYIMERIAHCTKKDPVAVRMRNFRKNNPIPEMLNLLKKEADYDNRVNEIAKFNDDNRWRKRAMKITPMQYGLFYFGNFNAIISIYHADGSVVVTHSGIEMGQGINTKVAQVVGYTLEIPLSKISVKPSSTFTSPNAMTTGGSIGSECAAFAALKACKTLMSRLAPVRQKMGSPSWEELIKKAYQEGIDLQATYMMSPKDGLKNYDIFGVTILEVEVDILTGNHQVRRVDIMEDTGQSLSPQVDIGQIEGAFVMGLGYWTSELLIYDGNTGQLLTDRTWTYKPPGIKDIPLDMRTYFRRRSVNEAGVLGSKATGEPSFCMAVAVTHALREAVRAARLEAGESPDRWVEIPNPCTAENIFLTVNHKIEDFKLK